MTSLARMFSLPLLVKELTEAAARRRTYAVRVVYAVALFGIFGFAYGEQLVTSGANPFEMLGRGQVMFEGLMWMQFAGIFLFMPALSAGSITAEKERDSLALLFLTELSPWQILWQKYLGALVPMFSFLLLALPLGAIAYSLGGISTHRLVTGCVSLVIAVLQVGAIGLFCSARCRTTVSAFLCTYLLGAGIYSSPLLLAWSEAAAASWTVFPPAMWEFMNSWGSASRAMGLPKIPILTLMAVPASLSTVVFLLLARASLLRYAFAPPSKRLQRWFRQLDAFMERQNQRIGGRVFGKPDSGLPEDEPIAWREMTQKTLGRPNHLVRLLLVIETIVITLCLLGSSSAGSRQVGLEQLMRTFGALAVLAVSVQAANAFVAERVQQTLDVLLTTPLTAAEIVRQKARVMRRFQFVCAVPLVTIALIEVELEHPPLRWWQTLMDPAPMAYLWCAILGVAVLLPLFSWLSLWIGMRVRTRFRASVVALGAIVAWCAVPMLVIEYIAPVSVRLGGSPMEPWDAYGWFLSPVVLLIVNETRGLESIHGGPWLPMVANVLFYSGVLFVLRSYCLRHADALLRR